jgi:hypothetical protein
LLSEWESRSHWSTLPSLLSSVLGLIEHLILFYGCSASFIITSHAGAWKSCGRNDLQNADEPGAITFPLDTKFVSHKLHLREGAWMDSRSTVTMDVTSRLKLRLSKSSVLLETMQRRS